MHDAEKAREIVLGTAASRRQAFGVNRDTDMADFLASFVETETAGGVLKQGEDVGKTLIHHLHRGAELLRRNVVGIG